jgi:hypothetical protein
LKETEERVWFSHWTDEYIIRRGTKRSVIEWLEGKPQIKMDWDNCMVDIAGHRGEGRIVLVIRSKTLRNSRYMGNIPVQLRYMLEVEFDIQTVRAPMLDRNYSLAASARKRLPPSARENPHDRWLLKLGDYEVWQWTEKGNDDIKSTLVYAIYQSIVDYTKSLTSHSLQDTKTWFRLNIEEIDNLVPVVYQPAVDSLDNFLREVHCVPTKNYDGSADIQVSLLFNNEHLRKFALADGLYRWWRKLWYGRTIDIETFTIHFIRDKQDSNYFVFQGIYSGDYDLQYDTIHLDNEKDETPPRHEIEFYFNNQYHPVVFVNTSNHAFAAHDNNGRLWKWEYIAWIKGSPVKYGTDTRDELNQQFKSIFSW